MSYKWCELSSAQIVILTDINHFYYANNKMMLYVGMSRAKSLLYVLCREKTYGDIREFSRGSGIPPRY